MRRHLPPFTAAALALLALAACSRPAPTGWQGYLEGDFVYIASPLAGRLATLAVVKGARVASLGARHEIDILDLLLFDGFGHKEQIS
jgi:hypothetical protein